jgi:hypothetical protein
MDDSRGTDDKPTFAGAVAQATSQFCDAVRGYPLVSQTRGARYVWAYGMARTPVPLVWRKHMGVEPISRPTKERDSGFEDRERHRPPSASAPQVIRVPAMSQYKQALTPPVPVSTLCKFAPVLGSMTVFWLRQHWTWSPFGSERAPVEHGSKILNRKPPRSRQVPRGSFSIPSARPAGCGRE